MDWTNKNVHPSKVVQLGDEVEVMILEIDEDRRRISLGMKQCKANPWEDFAANASKGDKVRGQIKSITDFGVFIGLPGGIDGLVHSSDLSWEEGDDQAARNLKKGDELEAVVLAIDVERERISLGLKQLDEDPFSSFTGDLKKGDVMEGTVKAVDSKGVTLDLSEQVEGYIKASEISSDRAGTSFDVGQQVSAAVTGIDRKGRVVNLSIKAKDHAEETLALKNHSERENVENAGTTNLGALLKAKIDGESNE